MGQRYCQQVRCHVKVFVESITRRLFVRFQSLVLDELCRRLNPKQVAVSHVRAICNANGTVSSAARKDKLQYFNSKLPEGKIRLEELTLWTHSSPWFLT